jgi:RNA polymerase sigma-70 factor (ECF subfamily)
MAGPREYSGCSPPELDSRASTPLLATATDEFRKELRPEALLQQRAWLRRLAGTLVLDAARADDLTQQTILAALERPPPSVRHPRAWLATVARNLAARMTRTEKQRASSERQAALREALPAVDEVLAKVAFQHEVVAALLALEPLYRTPLLLRYFEDLKPAAMARRLNLPVETVKTRLKRGIELLRDKLVLARSGGPREMALALLPWLDRSVRSELRRGLTAATKATSPTEATAIGKTSAAAVGSLGATIMSAKIKPAAAVIVVAVGSLVILELTRQPVAPASPASADTVDRRRPAPAATTSATLPTPAPVEPTRIADTKAPVRSGPEPVAPAVPSDALIEGIVRTETGLPASGALVAVAIVRHDGVFGSLVDVCRKTNWFLAPEVKEADGCRVKTGDDGRFRVDRLGDGAVVDLAAAHREEGLAFASGLALERSRLPLRVELTLTRGIVVHGSVRDEGGCGIPRADVSVIAERDSSRWTIDRVVADEGGEFRSMPLPFARFSLHAAAPGFLGESREAEAEEGGREVQVDFTLEPARTLLGRIVARDGGSACLGRFGGELVVTGSGEDPAAPEARIRWNWRRGAVRREEERYEIEYDDPAVRFVSLWTGDTLLGFAHIVDLDHPPDLPVDLARVDSTRAVGELVVEAVDEATGDALPDFTVVVARTAAHLLGLTAVSRSSAHAADGRLAIPDLEPAEYELQVFADGFAPRVVAARLAAHALSTTVVVELGRPSESLRGRILGEQARPVASASVMVRRTDGLPALPGSDAQAMTDRSGAFAIDGLPPGDCFVVAVADGLAPVCVRARAGSEGVVLTLQAGNIVTFHLQRLGEPFEGTYDYRVTEEAGVALFDLSGFNGGSARSVRLRPGRYTARFFVAGHRCDPVSFSVPSETSVPIEVVPEPSAR